MASPFISYLPYQSNLIPKLKMAPLTPLPHLTYGLERQYSVDDSIRKHSEELEKELKELEPKYKNNVYTTKK